MAAKEYRRFPLRVLRPRDQILGGTSNYYQLADPQPFADGFPMANVGGQLAVAGVGSPIVAFVLQDSTPADQSGDELETFLANDPSQTWLEGNLLSGLAGQQVPYALLQGDMFADVTLTYDPNYLGAGIAGFYFNVAAPGGGIGAVDGMGKIVSFINTRVPPDNEESYSVPGDTNAVVRVQMSQNEFLLPTTLFAGP